MEQQLSSTKMVRVNLIYGTLKTFGTDVFALEDLEVLKSHINVIPIPIFFKDKKGKYTAFNNAFERFVSMPADKIYGQNIQEVAPMDFLENYGEIYTSIYKEKKGQQIQAEVQYSDGKRRDVLITRAPYIDGNGEFHGVIGVITDISDVFQIIDSLRALCTKDELTSAFSRRYLMTRLDTELLRSKRHNRYISILMIDIDGFKIINDEYGHLKGDDFLKEVANRMIDAIRKTDFVARYGGDEFLIVLPETRKQSARILAERIRSSIKEISSSFFDDQVHPTVSIGIAEYPTDASGLSELLVAADDAMYKAKAKGKDRVELFGQEDLT